MHKSNVIDKKLHLSNRLRLLDTVKLPHQFNSLIVQWNTGNDSQFFTKINDISLILAMLKNV